MNDSLFIILLPIILLTGTWMVYRTNYTISDRDSNNLVLSLSNQSNERVQVEFFVMSKCPDAALCERLYLPILVELSSIVNFTLSFIAKESRLNSFDCLHGPSECEGNKQQLCIQNLYSQEIFMKYLLCQLTQLWLIPDNGEYCARQTSEGLINWSQVQSCMRSMKGNELFHRSLEQTRLSSARKSCTIHLNGKFWCMHDGYWINCYEGYERTNLIQAICSRYKGKNLPKKCQEIF